MTDWDDRDSVGWSRLWGADELEDDTASAPTLWEAEVAALSDEHLTALEESAEDA